MARHSRGAGEGQSGAEITKAMNAEDNNKLAAFERNKGLKSRSRSRIWETRIGGVLTATASLIAFVISLATFYYTNLRQADDLRVVIDTFPYVDFKGNPVQISVESWPTNFTFINAGNRAIAISRVALLVAQPGSFHPASPLVDPQPTSCPHPQSGSLFGGLSIDYEMAPFVIKPSEITIKTLNLRKTTAEQAHFGIAAPPPRHDKATEDSVALTLPLTPANQIGPQGYYLLACVFFGVTTPDSSVAYSITPLSRAKHSSNDPLQKDLSKMGSTYEHLYTIDKPIQALKDSNIPLFKSFEDWVNSWVQPKDT